MGGQVNKPLKITLLVVGAINLIIGIAILVQFIREMMALGKMDEYANDPANRSGRKYEGGSTMMYVLVTPFLMAGGCIAIALKPHMAFSIVTLLLAVIQIILCIVMAFAISSRWFINKFLFEFKDLSKKQGNKGEAIDTMDTLEGIYYFGQTICGIGMTMAIITIVIAALSLCKRCTSGGGFGSSSSGSTATF